MSAPDGPGGAGGAGDWERLAEQLGPQPSGYHPAPYTKPRPIREVEHPAYHIERDETGRAVRLWFRGIPVGRGDG